MLLDDYSLALIGKILTLYIHIYNIPRSYKLTITLKNMLA